jgi:HSP20 family protein
MANLARREPQFNELFDLRQAFDHLFNRLLPDDGSAQQNPRGAIYAVPPIEAWVDPTNKEYHLSIAVPGVDPKDVQVNLNGNELTVEGENDQSDKRKEANYLHREFSFQRFRRTITLPDSIDVQKLSAHYDNGVLELTAPLKESSLARKIAINTADKARAATS